MPPQASDEGPTQEGGILLYASSLIVKDQTGRVSVKQEVDRGPPVAGLRGLKLRAGYEPQCRAGEAVTQYLITLPPADFRLDFPVRKSVHAAQRGPMACWPLCQKGNFYFREQECKLGEPNG